MPRLRHASDPAPFPGSRTRRFIGGLRQRVRTAIVRGTLGPIDPDSALSSPVLRDHPYRIDR